jgi:HEAT repeat protein
VLSHQTKTPGADKIRQMLQGVDRTARKTKESLLASPLEKRWEVVRGNLAQLEKEQARDFIRLLFPHNQDFLQDKLKDEQEIIYAIECLGYCPSAGTVRILLDLLAHQEGTIQLAAAEALKNQASRQVVPALLKALLYEEVLPARAGEVLLSMGMPAQEALLAAYPVALPKVKAQFLELLVQGQNPKCKEPARQALAGTHKELILKALDAVAAFGFTDLWPETVRCLSRQMPWPIRVKALQTLEILSLPETKEALEMLLSEEDAWIREGARRVLVELAEKRRLAENRDKG